MMKRVIVALDGLDFSACAAKYAAFLASSAKANLTGVFLDDITYHSYRIYHLLDNEGVSENRLKELNEKDQQIREASVKEFEKICDQAKVKYKVRHDRNIALQELLTESIYADLLVIDRKETFSQKGEKTPNAFLKGVLNNMECPALVVPSSYKAFHQLIFLYDGSPPSVHAIKAFGYLLHAFCGLSLEIVTVKQAGNYPDLSGKYLMNEWIKKYFTHVTYQVLQGDPESAIVQYAKAQKNNPLFILGARQRGTFSYWFRESMADILIQKVQAPLFIVRY
jgi:nucleotide-binding universal stress UspA family protein